MHNKSIPLEELVRQLNMHRDYLGVPWKIDELRLVADTTKNAEGSNGGLRMPRPDLFFDPTNPLAGRLAGSGSVATS
jgi:hypothetical protein